MPRDAGAGKGQTDDAVLAHDEDVCCPECGSFTKDGCGAAWHDDAPEPSVVALAEALSATSHLAYWNERAEAIIGLLADEWWRLIRLAP